MGNRLVVADVGWAETIPDWLKKEVESERMVSGFADVLDKGIKEVGDAEACLYLYTLNLKQSVSHDMGGIYIYLASKLCKKQGMKLESFMEKKVKDGLEPDQERELRILKQELYTKRGGKVEHPIFEILNQMKKGKGRLNVH